jgi:hypothetical protein
MWALRKSGVKFRVIVNGNGTETRRSTGGSPSLRRGMCRAAIPLSRAQRAGGACPATAHDGGGWRVSREFIRPSVEKQTDISGGRFDRSLNE